MAAAIPQIPQKPISQNTRRSFATKIPSFIKTKSKFSSSFTDILKYCSKSRLKEAVQTLHVIKEIGDSPENIRILDRLLHLIALKRDLFLAREVYESLVGSNMHKNACLGTKIVSMFIKCGSLGDAIEAFAGTAEKNLQSLSIILKALCDSFCFSEALRLFCDLNETSHVRPDGFVLTSLLRACGGSKNIRLGKQVHGFIYRNGYGNNVFVGNCLIDMYGKCDCLTDACWWFDRMPVRDIVSWNSMLKAYVQERNFDGFAGLVSEMQVKEVEPNLITWNIMISGYAGHGPAKKALNCFYEMQSMGLKPDLISCNSLISALVQNGHVIEALELVRQMQTVGLQPDLVSWTSLIKGYVNLGCFTEALGLFSRVCHTRVALDELIVSAALKACSDLKALRHGKEIHGYIIRNGFQMKGSLNASLVNMYAKCQKLDLSRKLLSDANIVSWNSLIAGYIENGNVDEAKDTFKKLDSKNLKPDLVSWNLMINCLAQYSGANAALETLHLMQSAGISPDLISWNTLIKGFVKSGNVKDAVYLQTQVEGLGFEQSSSSWNILISDNVRNGNGEGALRIFHLMKSHGVDPDAITISCILRACALLQALHIGKSIHGRIIRSQMTDNYINSSLLEMYMESNDLCSARHIFARNPKRNLIFWNGMISGLAKKGKLHEAQGLLHKMQLEKLNPDVVSWTSVITGYVRGGRPDIGLQIWSQMLHLGLHPDPITITAATSACAKLKNLDYGKRIHGFSMITGLHKDPAVQAALISMYCKCGTIKDAVSIFERVSHLSTIIWNSMLSGYMTQKNGNMALYLFQRMRREGIDPNPVTLAIVQSACHQTNFQDFGNFRIMEKVGECVLNSQEETTKTKLIDDSQVMQANVERTRDKTLMNSFLLEAVDRNHQSGKLLAHSEPSKRKSLLT
ncbi:pentatricopeptide repeat-containing protein At5g55740, chloroplastic-like [Aristolochia californica]|uniref:pentatricopeptide repeat-containing protein At5g55740, chloroplastic-like n=1 Tax=Aristolochia californica TaxID=171875 RepID=UPI0035DBC0F3